MSANINFDDKDDSPAVHEDSELVYNSSQKQEVNELMEILKQEQNKYLDYKIIYDVIEDLIRDGDIDPNLKTKIKDIILSENVKQSLFIDSDTQTNKGAMSLLGDSKDGTVLTYSESSSLQELLCEKLSHNSATTPQSWTDLAESYNNLEPIQIDPDDQVLLEYRKKLDLEQQKYMKNLLDLNEVLEEITDLRVKKLPEVMGNKLKVCQVEQKINHLKCTISQQKCKFDIFTETSCSLQAYKELIKEVKEQQKDCQREIDDLNDLKKKYEEVSGKQFDDILHSYLKYKSSLEKKKMLYNCLKS